MIYADNAATTQLDSDALKEMLPYLTERYGNPSAPYSFGAEAKNSVETARKRVAVSINAQPDEVHFTSGGTESINWAFRCALSGSNRKGRHIITSSIEHPAVLQTCKYLKSNAYEVTYLPVDKNAVVSCADVKNAIREDTILVSVMLANNEVGSLQPIAEIAEIVHSRNDVLLHCDAVQAVGHIPVDVCRLGVDYLSASAHKFHGPKGTGFLFAQKGAPVDSLILGGRQENGLRAGTENVSGIVGMSAALEHSVKSLERQTQCLKELRQITLGAVKAALPEVVLNGCEQDGLPGIISLSFPGVQGEALMLNLDMQGICVSTGAACSSGSLKPSHVLKAMGVSPQLAKGTIRISYSQHNTNQDAEVIASAVIGIYRKLADFHKHK